MYTRTELEALPDTASVLQPSAMLWVVTTVYDHDMQCVTKHKTAEDREHCVAEYRDPARRALVKSKRRKMIESAKRNGR